MTDAELVHLTTYGNIATVTLELPAQSQRAVAAAGHRADGQASQRRR